MDSQAEPEPQFVCPHCQTGTLRPKAVVFAHWFEGQFITIPNFPGWVCDICGVREYDAEAIERLEAILGPEADLRREASRRARRGTPRPDPMSRPTGRRRV
jgi:YgiT-type zinc finger domain-containing protein